jgi:hypothetical protein
MDWKLTRNAIGEPEIDTFHDDPDDDPMWGYALMRALVEADESAEELAPGVYYFSKSSPGKMI